MTPFLRTSCGYVGNTDGWQDLHSNFKMDNQFAAALDGNIALTAEIDLRKGYAFTLGLGFGRELNRAVTTLYQSLAEPFAEHRARFLEQWNRACSHIAPLDKFSGDDGALYRRGAELLLAHEDKTYPGALIASLSIPWGEAKSDDDLGGYHLVWTRDMVNSVTGLAATGDVATALRALIYLACAQRPDGGFPQNFWIDGKPYWNGIQLDEVSFPIVLAWRLHKHAGLKDFDPYPMVLARGALPGRQRAADSAGAMGGERRLLALDAGRQYRRADLRRVLRARSRRPGHRAVPRGVRRLPRSEHRNLDRHQRRLPRPRHQAPLRPHQSHRH